MRKISKRAAVVLGATGVIVVAGVAYAAWTSTGSGSGEVKSTTSLNSTIAKLGDGSLLYPGGGTDFTVTISNPNSYPVVVNSISAGSSDAVNGCAAGTVTSAAVSNPSGTIAAGGSGTYTLHATMDHDAADACKSQTFSLPLTATLSSNA
ncbi:MAG TPA: LEA type 2 family protein [Amycolatopsis sp.]|nr:LEA type 2 family protein [Amycolatopsis sp.]